MTTKIHNKVIALLIIGVLVSLAQCRTTESTTRPNVLFITVDDLAPELGAYGKEHMNTPHMDKLAAQGVTFKNAFSQAPVCMASRISFLTGLRVYEFNRRTEELDRSFTTMPKFFKGAGYYTISLGKVFHHIDDRASDWSEKPWRSKQIYHGTKDWAHYNTYNLWQDPHSKEFINQESERGPYYEAADVPDTAYEDGQLARKAVEKLTVLKDKQQPFFMAVGFWRPHLPFNAPRKYWDLYSRNEINIAENRFRPKGLPAQVSGSTEITGYGRHEGFPDAEQFHRLTRHAYYASVSYVDRQVGTVLDALEKLEMDENTIVVLLGDHGYHLGEHNFWGKHNLMRRSNHTPLIIKAPGFNSHAISSIVELVDIYPTLADLAGIKQPRHLEGQSLQAIMEHPDRSESDWNNRAFSVWGNGRNITTDKYSYTEWEGSDVNMLFDYQNDPAENRNVVDDSGYEEVVNALANCMGKILSIRLTTGCIKNK